MTIPATWMPTVRMERIIVHWTAGTHRATAVDKSHYHVLIEGDGTVVRGTPKIGGKVAHTLNCNSGSIGVSLCCMGGDDVKENPFNAGKWPLTRAQWDKLPLVLADLARAYGIDVTPQTVLTHAEVWPNLKIKQKGKWDITRLAFDPTVKGHKDCGDLMRRRLTAALAGELPAPRAPTPLAPSADADAPEPALRDLVDSGATEDAARDVALAPVEAVLTETEITAAQQLLRDLKYFEVGMAGVAGVGSRTIAAIAAFKHDRNLGGEPVLDRALIAELDRAKQEGFTRPISAERAQGKPDDSRVLDAAEKQGGFGTGLTLTGITTYIMAKLGEYLEPVRNLIDTVGPYFRPIRNVVAEHWPLFVAAGGAFVVWQASRAWRARVQDHREGKTT